MRIKHMIPILFLLPLACFGKETEMSVNEDTAQTIIEMERQALDRWINGDPSGFLEIISEDYSYFDPIQEKRLDGYENIETYYESARGQIHSDFQKLFDPRVQVYGETAVLTFKYASWNKPDTEPEKPIWNATEVYHHYPEGWKLVHTHWSFTKEQE